MYKNGYLTVMKINFKEKNSFKKSSGLDDTSAPYFAEEVRRKMLKNFGFDALYEGGLSIRTTLNPTLQRYADDALFKGLESLDERQGWRGPIDNINLKKVSDNELNKILSKFQIGLPQNRIIGLVKKIKNNKIFLHTLDSQIELKFQNKSWLRKQIIYKDKDNRQQIGYGKNFKILMNF